ncbi:MAG: hypothetical protein H5U05_06635 [Candidatus Aminicenantes bacterium]|nr:hypothetical protein [Candidatus Aminicenantes bacterium]
MENIIYYGDNLDILGRYIPDESVNLVYLDPPFKSDQNYNILFREQNGSKAASQIKAFEDTWEWTQESEEIYAEIIRKGGKVADCLKAFRIFFEELLSGKMIYMPPIRQMNVTFKKIARCVRNQEVQLKIKRIYI